MNDNAASARVYWLLMRIEIPEVMGSLGMEHPDDPIGFMPVFATEAAALAHAGGVFAVHAIRLKATEEPPAPVGGPRRGR